MSGPHGASGADLEHVRAVWLLGLIAKRLRPRPDGTARLTLPANHVRAVREFLAEASDPAPSPSEAQAAFAAAGSSPATRPAGEAEPLGEVLDSYTRAQAVADGVLVDISQLAAQAGFGVPVAVTIDAWQAAVSWPGDDPRQDEAGRLWDVIHMAAHAVAHSHGQGQRVPFNLAVVPIGDDVARLMTLVCAFGADDTGHLAVTIMRPGED
jgi:hypothetical protein